MGRCLFTLGILLVFFQETQATESKFGLVIPVQAEIGPAMASFIDKSMAQAIGDQAHLVILTLNTPGGLLTSTRKIITTILNSSIPVIGYVSPQGAHAASAGTFILYATHLAVMAPSTNIGAAIPVQFSQQQGEDQQSDDLKTKIVNDTSALLRSLAERHGRDLEFAQESVTSGASITAREALEKNVINFVATDLDSLLNQINGYIVSIEDQPYELSADNLSLRFVEPSWQTRLLMIITNPTIAFLLLILGVYAILFEALSGFALILPGTVGLAAVLIGLYSLSLLPLNFTALLLIGIGFALILAEFFTPAFGGFIVGGTLLFFLGSIMLIDDPLIEINRWLFLSTTLVGSALILGIIAYALRDFRRPVTTGTEALINTAATVISWRDTQGYILLGGEKWQARSSQSFSPGQTVHVVSITGLIATVDSLERE